MENEINYWERLIETIDSFLIIKGKKELEFKDNILSLVSAHIDRLKYELVINNIKYYFISPLSKYWLSYWLINEKDIEEVSVSKCQYCALRDECKCGKEYCLTSKFGTEDGGLFVLYSDWANFIYKYNTGYFI